MTKNGNGTVLNPTSNDAQDTIELNIPYNVCLSIEGVCPILFHRWSVEGVEAKGKAAKGSAAKKSDDVESYIWRDENGVLCLPSEYLRMSIINAAKYKQDPRSPRKSAMDLVRAGLCCLDELNPFEGEPKEWQFLDRRRVMVQRNGITRSRPAFLAGWRVKAMLRVLLPQYLSPQFVHELGTAAGSLIGVADHRPTYGRFQLNRFEVIALEI